MLLSSANLSVLKISVPQTHLSLNLYFGVAGARDFPHSRQDVFDREVMRPQKGHILCDAKPRAVGVTDANSFETDALIRASRL
jgi:hypothetical protein